MTLGIIREATFESRVSMLAETAAVLQGKGIQVLVESGAGSSAFCSDEAYTAKGIEITARKEVLSRCELLMAIHPESVPADLTDKIILGVYQPLYQAPLMQQWASRRLTVFSLDMLPRTTRAQSMDVLSSQSSIAGYKAVLTAANFFPRYFPMFMTAAGSIAPARVLVLGAGVAGLQALATARRLGAVVEVFDTRAAVKEEVLSLGGKFVEVEGAADASGAGGYAVEQSEAYQARQKDKIAEVVAKTDVIITTAQIPGKKAPVLITKQMLEAMKEGSVIIDLAASTGGNTEVTKDQETIQFAGVRVLGLSNLPSSMPYDASRLYGKNLLNFLQLITGPQSTMNLNFEDDLVAGSCMTREGKVVNERILKLLAPNT